MQRLLLIALALSLSACGGRTLDDEFSDPAGGGTTEKDSGGSTTETSTGTDASTEEDVFFGEDASSTDAFVPPSEDTAPPIAGITCGKETCNASTQQCCVSGGMGGASYACRPKGTSCGDRAVSLSCTSAAGCGPGQTCCLRLSMMGSAATCSATCEGRDNVRVCTVDSECRAGERCRSTGIGVRVCEH